MTEVAAQSHRLAAIRTLREAVSRVTCKCGEFVGYFRRRGYAKFSRLCKKCKAERDHGFTYDLCECGREKKRQASHCMKCAGQLKRKFDHEECCRLYQSGEWDGTMLAEKYGVIRPAIYAALQKAGVKRRNRGSRIRSTA